jgi:hypothetical protein
VMDANGYTRDRPGGKRSPGTFSSVAKRGYALVIGGRGIQGSPQVAWRQ